MKKFLNNAVAIFVILIIALIIIPLPTPLLDMMFILNITFSLIILLMTMYIKTALDFSVFPSILLIATIFRLSLNISSTRQILTNQGFAGQVIKTFGTFVLGGNVVVGFIVFLIIVLVNFLVITKGSERVSEVAARFKLDAMPGKQMAIDADLNSGLIDEMQARKRREDVQREAEFYGSMDGASKFVKGDAVMSIVITFINLIAGMIIGMVQDGKSFNDVLQIYTIASVGDGLVSQIPSLLISTATGMIVTRAASDSTLGKDVTRQFLAQPTVIMITGFAVAGMCLIPNMPIVQLLIVSALLITFGAMMRKKQKEFQEPEAAAAAAGGASASAPANETEFYRNIDNIYKLLPLDAIEMEFGYSLIPLVDERSGSSFIDRLVMFRKQFATDMGMVVPPVRLRDGGNLNPNQYVIKIKGEEVARGEILMDYYLALDPGNLTGEIDGIDTIEPAYGIPSKWITPDKKDLAEIYGYTVIDPLSVVVTHLSETVRQHAHELLSRQDVHQILDNLKKYNEPLVTDVVPNVITEANLQKVLCNLLRGGIPIRDIESILETVSNYAPSIHDPELLTEYVRQSLRRTITRQWSEGGQIKVITLDGQIEKAIVNSISKNEHGTYLSLDPQTTQKIITKLTECINNVKDIVTTPIILTSPIVRLYFSKLMQQFCPKAVVLSFNELENNVQIQAVANVSIGST